jgi:hypothetical protein
MTLEDEDRTEGPSLHHVERSGEGDDCRTPTPDIAAAG